jgi:hypothetical protein
VRVSEVMLQIVWTCKLLVINFILNGRIEFVDRFNNY